MPNKNLAIVSLLLIATAVSALPTYCPAASDLSINYGYVRLQDQGWNFPGGPGSAATKAAFNLLGGSVEFDIDVSSVKTGVSTSIGTVSPKVVDNTIGFQARNYCNGRQLGDYWCVELDWFESNGNCGGATTLHTIPGPGTGCTASGCKGEYHFDGKTSFHMKVDYAEDGTWKAYRDGNLIQLETTPKPSDLQTLAQNYKERGAVIYSIQTTPFWGVPVRDCGINLSRLGIIQSSSSISNLKITGTVVKGPTPRTC